jgi:hypothetical protein
VEHTRGIGSQLFDDRWLVPHAERKEYSNVLITLCVMIVGGAASAAMRREDCKRHCA